MRVEKPLVLWYNETENHVSVSGLLRAMYPN